MIISILRKLMYENNPISNIFFYVKLTLKQIL